MIIRLNHLLRADSRFRKLLVISGLSFLLQTGPGVMMTSWATECSGGVQYCVGSLADSGVNTLRAAIDSANAQTDTATVGFQPDLFSSATNQAPAVITLQSTLVINTNIAITGPVDQQGKPILAIERGAGLQDGAPLISVNSTPNPEPSPSTSPTPNPEPSPSTSPTPNPEPSTSTAENKATDVVRIENVILDGKSQNLGNQQIGTTPGGLIEVNSPSYESPAPTVELINVVAQNSVSNSSGAVVNTPGDVKVVDSTIQNNAAVAESYNPEDPISGGAIKSGGEVLIENSQIVNNSTTGNGGAISAVETVTVTSSSVVANNFAEGDGGAIKSETKVIVTTSEVVANRAVGNGGAISAPVVDVSMSTLSANQAGGNGGAISASETVTVTSSVLGTSLVENPNYDPIETIPNPNYNPVQQVSNPTYEADPSPYSATGVSSPVMANLDFNPVALLSNPDYDPREIVEVGNTATADGGAIFSQGTVVITNSNILGSHSESNGGAIYGKVARVTSSEFQGNSAELNGGSIFAEEAIEVADSEFTETEVSNREYDPREFILNPNYNPARTMCELFNLPTLSDDFFGSVCLKDASTYYIGEGYGFGSSWSYFTADELNDSFDPNQELLNPNYNPYLLDEISSQSGISGGVIYSGGTTSISGSTFENSDARDSGGAIFSESWANIEDSEFIGNQSGFSGGAVAINADSEGLSSIKDSTFIGNSSIIGGAVAANSKLLRIESEYLDPDTFQIFITPNVFASNYAFSGGAIFHSGSIEISNYLFEHNSAIGPMITTVNNLIDSEIFYGEPSPSIESAQGGAVFGLDPDELNFEDFETSNSRISNSVFEENGALGNGGGISFQGLLYVLNSRFFRNQTIFGSGGAINSYSVEVTSSAFEENFSSLTRNPQGYEVSFCDEFGDYLGEACFMNASNYGGAINSQSVSLFGTNDQPNYFAHNSADVSGGAINANEIGGQFTQFIGNVSLEDGGAIHVEGEVNLSYVSFLNNQSLYADGGAIDIDPLYDPEEDIYLSYNSTIESSSFIANSAVGDGGGIDGNDGQISILDTEFIDNYSGDAGGAIWNGGAVLILDSAFSNNTSVKGGGAVYADSVNVARARFLDNSTALNHGGAIFVSNYLPELSLIISSEFMRNGATQSSGGAIFGTSWIITSTLIDNFAADSGQAVFLTSPLGSQLIGSKIVGTDNGLPLCNMAFFNSPSSYATDSSCFASQNLDSNAPSEEQAFQRPAFELLNEVFSMPADYFTSSNRYFGMIDNSVLVNDFQNYIFGVLHDYRSSEDYNTLISQKNKVAELIVHLLGLWQDNGYEWGFEVSGVPEDLGLTFVDSNFTEFDLSSLESDLEVLTTMAELASEESPIIDAIEDLYNNSFIRENVKKDIIGTTRPRNSVWDVGATQYSPDSETDSTNNSGGSSGESNDNQGPSDSLVDGSSNSNEVNNSEADRALDEELMRRQKEYVTNLMRIAAEKRAAELAAKAKLKADRKARLLAKRLKTQEIAKRIATRNSGRNLYERSGFNLTGLIKPSASIFGAKAA